MDGALARLPLFVALDDDAAAALEAVMSTRCSAKATPATGCSSYSTAR
jgi:hypothetical protein